MKPIAIYLPQFHPFKENDEWWGKGFTEWTNVTKASPRFAGHYQPQLPADLGFYDLRLEATFVEQALLAKKYGIHGFCYYHYWFNSKLLMEKPLEMMLASTKIDMPFCLCWANENWTRTWDGSEQSILIEQHYNLDDDLAHFHYLLPFFKDDRYIKIDGCPVFVMYRTELHPNINEAANLWRQEAKKAGFKDLYLIRVENFLKDLDPTMHGFDAGMEFAPDFSLATKRYIPKNTLRYTMMKVLHKTGLKRSGHISNRVFRYSKLVDDMIAKPKLNYKQFRCITPAWDNSARRKTNATIFHKSTPEKFGEWVSFVKQYTKQNFKGDEQLFFINAWNEWAEGCHLEPDLKNGTAYLEALAENLDSK